MSREQLSPIRKGLALGEFGLAAILGGNILDHHDGPEELAVVDLAKFGGGLMVITGVVKAGGGIAESLMIAGVQKKEQELEDRLNRLPKFSPGSFANITPRLKQPTEEDRIPGIEDVPARLPLTLAALKQGKGFDLRVWALDEDINRVVDDLIEVHSLLPWVEEKRTRQAEINSLALFLDETLPIADDCPNTLQTDDPVKYWFDYIEHQAFQREGLVLSVA